jgi:hypothetical protein
MQKKSPPPLEVGATEDSAPLPLKGGKEVNHGGLLCIKPISGGIKSYRFGDSAQLRLAVVEIAKAWRVRMPLSHLAEIFGVTRKTVRYWLNGGIPQPKIGNGGRIDAALDTVLQKLAEWDELEKRVMSCLPGSPLKISKRIGVEPHLVKRVLVSLEKRRLVQRAGRRMWKLTDAGWREALLVGAVPSWRVELEFKI